VLYKIKDENNYTETDGLCFDEQWHDFQLYHLSRVEKLHKGHVIASAYLSVFLASGRQSVEIPAEDTVPVSALLKYPAQVNPTQGLQSDFT